MKLTEPQRKILKSAAAHHGYSWNGLFSKTQANVAERLARKGLIRVSCYGDKYFATPAGRNALTEPN